MPQNHVGLSWLFTLLTVAAELGFSARWSSLHYASLRSGYVKTKLSNNGIERGGPVSWPSRSPHLTPSDFSLWGHLELKIHPTPIHSTEVLQRRIVAEVCKIREEALSKVRDIIKIVSKVCKEWKRRSYRELVTLVRTLLLHTFFCLLRFAKMQQCSKKLIIRFKLFWTRCMSPGKSAIPCYHVRCYSSANLNTEDKCPISRPYSWLNNFL